MMVGWVRPKSIENIMGKRHFKKRSTFFFPKDRVDGDDIEEDIDASHDWASQWTPMQINNSVYFTYGLLHKRGGVRTKYARFIIGDSVLGQKLYGLRKGKRKILHSKTKKK